MKVDGVPGRHASGGFSLVELIIVVVVASVIAAIAVPSYQAHARKSRRAAATAALFDAASRHHQLADRPGVRPRPGAGRRPVRQRRLPCGLDQSHREPRLGLDPARLAELQHPECGEQPRGDPWQATPHTRALRRIHQARPTSSSPVASCIGAGVAVRGTPNTFAWDQPCGISVAR